MTCIDLDRVTKLVERDFDSVGDGPPQTPSYSFKMGFPVEPLTEREKRSIYSAVIGFARQLKRQTGRTVLRWRTRPELSCEGYFDPPQKLRVLYFRVGADAE